VIQTDDALDSKWLAAIVNGCCCAASVLLHRIQPLPTNCLSLFFSHTHVFAVSVRTVSLSCRIVSLALVYMCDVTRVDMCNRPWWPISMCNITHSDVLLTWIAAAALDKPELHCQNQKEDAKTKYIYYKIYVTALSKNLQITGSS